MINHHLQSVGEHHLMFYNSRYLNTGECKDEQFVFESRGDVMVKGMKTPVKCFLLSRNLKKLPKVHLLLENDLAIGSRGLLSGGVSPPGSL